MGKAMPFELSPQGGGALDRDKESPKYWAGWGAYIDSGPKEIANTAEKGNSYTFLSQDSLRWADPAGSHSSL